MSFFNAHSIFQPSYRGNDSDEFLDFLGRWKLRPIFDGDPRWAIELLNIIHQVSRLSPSYESATGVVKNLSFGGAFGVIEGGVGGANVDRTPANPEVQKAYLETLQKLGLKTHVISKVAGKLYNSRKECGCQFLLIHCLRAGDKRHIKLTPLHYTEVMQLRTPPLGRRAVMVTPVWDESKWKNDKTVAPRIYALTMFDDPFWNWEQISKDGDFATVLQINNDKGKSPFYGWMEIESILYDMLTEYYYAKHRGKVASSEVVTKIIALFQETVGEASKGTDNKADEFATTTGRLRRLMTNRGEQEESNSLITISYPRGVEKPTFQSINLNRDYLFMRESIQTNRGNIFGNFRINPELAGVSRAPSGIGSNIMRGMYINANALAIEPEQNYYEIILNEVIRECFEVLELPVMDLSFTFENKVEKLVNQFNDTSGAESTPSPTATPETPPDDRPNENE